MQKNVVFWVLLVLVAAAGAFYFIRQRPMQEQLTVEQIKAKEWRDLLKLSLECEQKVFEENCTIIFEVLALKSQHARQGESFWVKQMLRLSNWYAYAGTRNYKTGGPDAPEIKKATETLDWLEENKPFFGDQIMLARAKIYDTENAEWSAAHKTQAREMYQRLQTAYPSSPYATAATAALAKLQ